MRQPQQPQNRGQCRQEAVVEADKMRAMALLDCNKSANFFYLLNPPSNHGSIEVEFLKLQTLMMAF